jgi:hypothetical protein
MVIRHPESDEYTLHEYGLVERNLIFYGDLKFRAQVVKAMHDSVHTQVKQRVQSRLQQGEFEPTRTIKISHEMTDKIIDSLRGPAFDEQATYIVNREDLQQIVTSYDEVRREQIIAAQ